VRAWFCEECGCPELGVFGEAAECCSDGGSGSEVTGLVDGGYNACVVPVGSDSDDERG
jgi:hypothetical protein